MRRKGYLLANTQKIYPPGGVEIKLHRGGVCCENAGLFEWISKYALDLRYSYYLGGWGPVGSDILGFSMGYRVFDLYLLEEYYVCTVWI